MGKGKNKQDAHGGVQNGSNNDQDKGEAKKEDIVLKAYMHCQGCCQKIYKCLKYLEGVEDIVIDSANHKVVVKGKKADPKKALERLQKKYSRNVELIHPKPKPESEKKKEQEKKEEEVQVKVVVLKMSMHCEGCANDIKKNIQRMKGILTVEPNMETSRVTVRGAFEPPKLVEDIKKRLGKHVEIIVKKPEQAGLDQQGKGNNKEAPEGENIFQYPPQYSLHHIYPHQMFSDENVFSCSIM